MKRLGLLLFLIVAVAMMSGNALAQDNFYFLTYFSNANTPYSPDAVVRFVNDGWTEATIWADYYVFDDSQEIQECCSCPITPDGMNSEWINSNQTYSLTGNTVTGKKLVKGVIKVIADSTNTPYAPTTVFGLHGSVTHSQNAAYNPTEPAYTLTEVHFFNGYLSASERTELGNLCQWAVTVGSGKGVCSCTPEDQDF